MLINGKDLTTQQKKEVLEAFIYRWTYEMEPREKEIYSNAIPHIPRITDEEWLQRHAFHFKNDGSHLMKNVKFCVTL